MISFDISYKFLTQRADLGWNEIKFGLDHQLIKPKIAVDKAVEQLSIFSDAPSEVVELASLNEADSNAALVMSLANKETSPAMDSIRKKWLYLVLAWVFENRDSLTDPLGVVEEVYEDFDYSQEVAPFVRYMPMVGVDLGNKEQNEARMFNYWKTYLDQTAASFQKKSLI